MTDVGDLISLAGEGIVIGLLEVLYYLQVDRQYQEAAIFEERMFDAFKSGPIFEAMKNSKPTPTGSGRLTTALVSFVAHVWIVPPPTSDVQIRKERLLNLLTCWKETLFNSQQREALAESPKELCFLENFAGELAAKLFLHAPLEIQLSLLERAR